MRHPSNTVRANRRWHPRGCRPWIEHASVPIAVKTCPSRTSLTAASGAALPQGLRPTALPAEPALLHRQGEDAQSRRGRAEVREWIHTYLQEHPCIDCGESDVRTLEFGHRDGEKKSAAVAVLARGGHSLGRVRAEIDRCDVRCANCHRIRTHDQRGGGGRCCTPPKPMNSRIRSLPRGTPATKSAPDRASTWSGAFLVAVSTSAPGRAGRRPRTAAAAGAAPSPRRRTARPRELPRARSGPARRPRRQ